MRKNELFKALSLVLAGAFVFASPMAVFADDEDEDGVVEYQDSDDEGFTNDTGVNAEIGSSYKVVIPKVIVLSGVTKKAAYQVTVNGDIAGKEVVTVAPDASFALKSANKDDQTAEITQEKQTWSSADVAAENVADKTANGLIEADGITAGSWSGTFNFNINLDTVE